MIGTRIEELQGHRALLTLPRKGFSAQFTLSGATSTRAASNGGVLAASTSGEGGTHDAHWRQLAERVQAILGGTGAALRSPRELFEALQLELRAVLEKRRRNLRLLVTTRVKHVRVKG